MPRIDASKHIIMFLAANPLGTDRLALDREVRAIHMELGRSGRRDRFELVTRWAAEPLDLLRGLRELKPTVVHFSAHGRGPLAGADRRSALLRDVVGPHNVLAHGRTQGLCLQGADGRPQFVSATALRQTFRAAGASVRLVVFNACYSDAQAAALVTHVDCVVGMSGLIQDDVARSFAIGFYGGLGEGASVAIAYEQGRAAIGLEALRNINRPRLRVRSGIDAHRLVLAEH